jgi:[ribosomal protein S5]-alanine N-acetyltransferase
LKDKSLNISTDRLILISATADLVQAELEGAGKLGNILDAHVPAGWPPGEYDRSAQDFFLALLLKSSPKTSEWYNWYAITKPDENGISNLIGAGGYTGAPDENGNVEIGYSVVTEYRGKGYATEFIQALIKRAFSFTDVKKIIAQTTPENIASRKVLEKLSFTLEGEGEQFGTIRYTLKRIS